MPLYKFLPFLYDKDFGGFMNIKRVLGALIIVAGIVLLYISNYITQQINQGQEEIASAKKKINQGEQLFSFNPVAKEVGKGLTSGAKKQIRAGEETIAHYTQVADWCQKGGIGLIVLGAIVVIFGRSKKKK
jgi:uncharacterized membrane protein